MENFTYKSKYGAYEGCQFRVNKYQSGNTRLDIFSPTEGPICTVTTDVGRKFPDDVILIKDYSENEGMYDWLVSEGIIEEEALFYVSSGYMMIPAGKLTEKGLAIVEG